MLITALLVTAALTGAPAPEPVGDPVSVVATAPATPVDLGATAAPEAPSLGGAGPSASDPHGLSTDQQIAQWLAARAPSQTPPAEETRVWRDDRETHGEVSVGFGTGGYRDYAAAMSLPLGESARLDISVRQVKNGYPYGYGYGYGYDYGRGYGYDPYFDDRGVLFPGGRAFDPERRPYRGDGPGERWSIRPLQPAAE